MMKAAIDSIFAQDKLGRDHLSHLAAPRDVD